MKCLVPGASCLVLLGAGGLVLGAFEPQRGITAASAVAKAYDSILDADFERVPAEIASACGPAPRVACLGLEALSRWWQIQLDPDSRALDPVFSAKVEEAIAEAERLTRAEPSRAEAWFYLGAAYGTRAQWRVLRLERFAAARDGKRIKQALERALALDPAMHDAEFGLGMYRYYADVAPAYLRFLRLLLLLPGGDRADGLRQIERSAKLGQLVRGEAIYQIHVIDLWYENKSAEALTLVRTLQTQYPHNPLFYQLEAEIEDVYFHRREASITASERLLALARERKVFRADIAEVRARMNLATQLIALKQYARALEQLDAVIALRPSAPAGAHARAQQLRRSTVLSASGRQS
jgi:cytochrome c-type biogenesis protein CcmH/NrfG